jgi:outer membrane biosynthesis protein TonB
MEKYKIAGNHVMFEELDSDSLGTNYRAGVIKDKKVEKHCLLTEVYPDIVNSPKAWRRVKILIEGINNQNIPGLYCPEEIVEEDQRAMLVYPFVNGKSLEALLEDTDRTHTAMELELILSIVFEIADALDNSSAIIINKKRSFHGVVTPDNIFVDFDGKVYLRNYGIFPYLEDAPQLLTETIKKFRNMFAPEVLQNKELSVQSDIYHLGNIIHRLITGDYFKPSPGEDFESRLAKLDLEEYIMLPEEGFDPKIKQLLKKTLNPDPSKRFASIKEFKEYLSKYFRIEELSSATFRLAYFMNQEYKKIIEEREKIFPEELAYSVPEIKPKAKAVIPIERDKIDDAMIEDILIELEQQKRSRVKLIIPFIVILIVVIGVSGYLFIQQQKEAQLLQKQAQLRLDELQKEADRRIAEVKAQYIEEYQRRIKSIEQKTAVTEEEKKAQSDEIERLKKWREEQEQEQVRLIRERTEALARLERERQQREAQEKIEKQKPPEVTKPKETVVATKPEVKPPVEQPKIEQPAVKTLSIGDMISLDSVTFAPSKLSGSSSFKSQDLKLPESVLNQYGGQHLTVESDILINEFGSVTDTKIKGNLPTELQSEVNNLLKTWRYIAAEKDKVKVKVWMLAKLTIAFEGEPPKATKVEAPKYTEPVPLNSLTYKPSKLSGTSTFKEDDLKLSKSTSERYAGKKVTIDASILINEQGKVTDVNIKGSWPNEIKAKVTDVLKQWTYTPAEKDKVKVKVWFPTDLTIAFKKPAPKEVVIPIPKSLTPLNQVTYRPSKMSGSSNMKANELKLPGSVKRQYKGKTITINATILINEVGSIIRVNLKKGDWPDELQSGVKNALKSWKYIPAEKDKVKVAVWLPVKVRVTF